jgi:hypothetical protein
MRKPMRRIGNGKRAQEMQRGKIVAKAQRAIRDVM